MKYVICSALLLAVVACSDRSKIAASNTGNDSREMQTELRLALLQPSNATNLAALEGYLHTDGSCIYITGRGGSGMKALPAFTIPGIRWDSRREAIIARGRAYRLGERVLLAGGEPFEGQVLNWVQPPHPGCDTSDIFIVGDINPPPE